MKKESTKEVREIKEEDNILQEAKIEEAVLEKVDETAEIISALQDKIKELEEKNVRSQAEMVNYRRRTEENNSRMLKYANEGIILDILNTVDDLERAIKLDDRDLTDELSKFLEGIKMIYSRLIEILNKYEVKEMICEHDEFDPTYHQAVLTEKDPNLPANVILEVLQKGYMYKDKVIRYAKVKVNE